VGRKSNKSRVPGTSPVIATKTCACPVGKENRKKVKTPITSSSRGNRKVMKAAWKVGRAGGGGMLKGEARRPVPPSGNSEGKRNDPTSRI